MKSPSDPVSFTVDILLVNSDDWLPSVHNITPVSVVQVNVIPGSMPTLSGQTERLLGVSLRTTRE